MTFNKASELALGDESLSRVKERIVSAIRKTVSISGCRGVVLGLSGGIDSSVVLALACASDVPVHALIMPDSVSSPSDVSDARDLAESLGARYSIIDISEPFDIVKNLFPWDDFPRPGGMERRVCEGNVKARLRMIYNYLAANIDGRIVLGTGNRTEILLGYGTKYGDCGVDIQPIGSLYKTQVRELASFLGIPDKLIWKTPSAGLWEGQTDEAELGASYETIDRLLHSIVDLGLAPGEASAECRVDPVYAEKIVTRMERNRHKSEPARVVEL